ncbi:MAG TPA: hypothetical protein VJ813_10820 [Vicinamibacterales bacterium]|nr:hypothetical protein [Vicinamibacterales bacterium]
MSVRLFHRHARLVVTGATRDRVHTWYAWHWRPVAWADIFAPALLLVGFPSERGPAGLRFGDGSVHWTKGPLWTTIRLQLPPCSDRKAGLLASGLLKAARYADTRGVSICQA